MGAKLAVPARLVMIPSSNPGSQSAEDVTCAAAPAFWTRQPPFPGPPTLPSPWPPPTLPGDCGRAHHMLSPPTESIP
jgi:hypothetical protein